MPEQFEEFIKDNTPGPDGQPREKEEDPGFFRRYVSFEAPFQPCLTRACVQRARANECHLDC
eukprot:COSAG03_NODE_1599_length_3807_cov_7.276699_4_plen_62_part_00